MIIAVIDIQIVSVEFLQLSDAELGGGSVFWSQAEWNILREKSSSMNSDYKDVELKLLNKRVPNA